MQSVDGSCLPYEATNRESEATMSKAGEQEYDSTPLYSPSSYVHEDSGTYK